MRNFSAMQLVHHLQTARHGTSVNRRTSARSRLPGWHIRLLIPYIGRLDVHQIHDGTIEPFVADRLASDVSATTINRSLEVVRTILNRAARSYRDEDGRPWLETMPPLITMLPETPRAPYPITWNEQDRLFAKLPARLARMVLFAVKSKST
jgi:hypothetical protein